MLKKTIIILIFLLITAIACGDEPKVSPDPQLPESNSDPESKPEDIIDLESQLEIKLLKAQFYSDCEAIFTKYVDQQGRVDYKALHRGQPKRELIAAVRTLSNIHPAEYMSWSDKEKIAFWINAYNLCTIKLIIDNYPIKPIAWMFLYPKKSIKQIPGPRTKHYFKVIEFEYNLFEIEREMLLGRHDDPRIAFALCHATVGSPPLRNKPYYPEKLDQQLDDQVKKFLQNKNGMKINRNNNTIYLSDVFDWHRTILIEKFGKIKKFRDKDEKTRAFLNFIIKYISDDDVKYIESRQNITIKTMRYDWLLNEQPKKIK